MRAPLFNPQHTLGFLWCSIMHRSLMWPVHGYYECRTCGRLHPVPWAETWPSGRVSELTHEFRQGSFARQSGD